MCVCLHCPLSPLPFPVPSLSQEYEEDEEELPEGHVWIEDEQTAEQAMEVDGNTPADDWVTTGHEWINKRVRRIFPVVGGTGGSSDGTITAWAPPDEDGDQLWRMTHDDGDVEDLEDYEVKELMNVGPSFYDYLSLSLSRSLLLSLFSFSFSAFFFFPSVANN